MAIRATTQMIVVRMPGAPSMATIHAATAATIAITTTWMSTLTMAFGTSHVSPSERGLGESYPVGRPEDLAGEPPYSAIATYFVSRYSSIPS